MEVDDGERGEGGCHGGSEKISKILGYSLTIDTTALSRAKGCLYTGAGAMTRY